MNSEFFKEIFTDSISVKHHFIDTCAVELFSVAKIIVQRLRASGKILLFGNGGSAADAQHLAAEFVNRLTIDRPAIPAIALTTDTSVLTSVGNDAGFDELFARQVEALGNEGDIAWAISTSGNSPNMIRAVQMARNKGLVTIGFLGKDGGALKSLIQHPLVVSSNSAQRIQETHITMGHALCEYIEQDLFGI